MTPPSGTLLAAARDRVQEELRRAATAADVARRHEQLARGRTGTAAEFHARIGRLHRRVERLHRATASVHGSFADRLRAWLDGTAEPDGGRPRLIATVAETLHAAGAAVTLLDAAGAPALIAASDRIAREAQEAELVLGEGPGHDATRRGQPVVAAAAVVSRRWPQYGAAVADLGVRAVVAMPLQAKQVCLGGLVLLNPTRLDDNRFQAMADTVTNTLLLDKEADQLYAPLLTEPGDHLDLLHLAAGMVTEQAGCDIAAALALIRARAFATGEPTGTIAHRIVAGEVRLG